MGAGVETATVDLLVREATEYARRSAVQRRLRTQLKAAGRPMYDLPDLDEPAITRLYTLAAALTAQGAA